jgi:hypothetical protein
LLGFGIRWATQEKGEEKTIANHVGCIVRPGTALNAFLVEALWTVKNHSFWDKYHGVGTVAVYRSINLTYTQRVTIHRYLLDHVGEKYGWWKILFHLGYKLTGKRAFLEPLFIDDRPICHYLIAKAYEAAGLDFGSPARLLDPDEVMDFCRDNPDKYELIHPMKEI